MGLGIIGASESWFKKATTTWLRTIIGDGDTLNYLEIMAQAGMFNPLYMPVLSVTSFNNNITDKQLEFWHDGFMQYYISYDINRDDSFRIIENNILLVSQCTALALENGDYLELE